MARTGIALGSNLGDRIGNLRAALAALHPLSTAGKKNLCASLYETKPFACPEGSPSFLNTVIEIDWATSPNDLLERTRIIEIKLGRIPNPIRNAPRIIDIDLLYYDCDIINDEHLILPHPRMHQRPFVLIPLAEIRPDYLIHGIPIQRVLNEFEPTDSPPRKIAQYPWA